MQEKLGAGGLLKTVRRNPAFRDNASLPSAFKDIVGKAIYTGLVNGFEEVEFGGPVPCEAGASFDCVSPALEHSVQSQGLTGVLLLKFC
jgi:hypothetical protein